MKTLGLVQINNSFSQANYLPYSTGLLQAYCQQNYSDPGELHFLLPLYCRLPVQEAVESLLAADLVGFSTYNWNIRLSLAIARELKARKPSVLILFGGPQVPDEPGEFLAANPFIDLACHGEGEIVYTQVVERFQPGAWKRADFAEIPSLSFLEGETLVRTPRSARVRDLNELPSPYLAGVFDALMAAHPGQEWLILWETNRGCPFSCTFCDWGSATAAKVYQFGLERLQAEVDWFAERKIEFIFCCDANFGILPRDLEIARHVAQVKGARGYPQALSVQNTKNATERAYEVQKTLAVAGLNKGVTLSMQSVDPHTLKSIKRHNISLDSYQELQRRFTRDGIETYSDMILGLPGETYDSFLDGVATIIANGQHNRIQFNNLGILPNAEMADPEYRRKFGMQTVETRIVNIHGSLEESADGIYETQELVVGTAATPPEDWVRVRAFCWMAALVHFDKLLQVPLVLCHELGGLGYRELLEAFAQADSSVYPVVGSVREFFEEQARALQGGGLEYVRSQEWLNIYWPADEYALIRLAYEERLEGFYADALAILQALVRDRLPAGVLAQAVRLNRSLLKLPFVTDELVVNLDTNLWEVYRGAVEDRQVPLVQRPSQLSIGRSQQSWSDWDRWAREVIWWGNKKGAYLYTNTVRETQLEGHY